MRWCSRCVPTLILPAPHLGFALNPVGIPCAAVAQELDILEEEAQVYKLIGPVLVKQARAPVAISSVNEWRPPLSLAHAFGSIFSLRGAFGA